MRVGQTEWKWKGMDESGYSGWKLVRDVGNEWEWVRVTRSR